MMVYVYKDDKITEDSVDDHKRVYVFTPKTLQVMAFWLSNFGVLTYCFYLLAKPLLQSPILFRQLLELLIKVAWK